MELKESYVRKWDDGGERVTHIKCTNCDGQALIKLVEKWTDIFREWAPIGYVRQDVRFDEEYLEHFAEESEDYAKEEKEKIWDKFSLEIIDEADMPAPFDKYFHPWEKKRIRMTTNEAYGERVCIRGQSETGATVCICFRSGEEPPDYIWAGCIGMWDRFVLYKPSGKEKTMLTYIVTDKYSPQKLDNYFREHDPRVGQLDMNFYLDFDKGDDNYIAVEGTSGCYHIERTPAPEPYWSGYARGLKYGSKEGDAGYSDFCDMDLSLFKYLDEASKGFFEMLRLNKDSLWNLGLNKEKVRQEREKARQEKMKHMSEEERAAMEKQSSLLDSLDSI